VKEAASGFSNSPNLIFISLKKPQVFQFQKGKKRYSSLSSSDQKITKDLNLNHAQRNTGKSLYVIRQKMHANK